MAQDINISEIFEKINNINIEDIKNVGTAPPIVKIIILVVFFVAIMAGGTWFITKPVYENISKAEKKEVELKKQYVVFQAKAATLEAYRAQVAELEKSFAEVLQQLPNTINIENLLVDLTQTSLAAGLQIEKFEPLKEEAKEFYAATPISIRVKGSFHQLGHFVSGLAALQRIVTLSNIKITQPSKANFGKLDMTLEASTYRYLDKDENKENENKKKGENKK